MQHITTCITKAMLLCALMLALVYEPGYAQYPQEVVNISTPTHSQTVVTQIWTVPSGGPYRLKIIAKGGKGGRGFNNGQNLGGPGAIIIGEFVLSSGQILELTPGAPGGDASGINGGGGGGGGSGVKIKDGALLIVAGGGGGGGYLGTGGNGGPGISGPIGSYTIGGGGGGGDVPTGNGSATTGGASGLIGGGGIYSDFAYAGGGAGVGGGGGGVTGGRGGSGGGGGGYSGGNGGGLIGPGTGGGSYNAGINQTNTAGANNAGGQVIIENLGPVTLTATAIATQPTCTTPTQGSVTLDLTGNLDGNNTDFEYAIVAGNSFTGTPTFTSLTADPLVLSSGTGTTADADGETYTVRIRARDIPDLFVDNTYTLTSPSVPARLHVNASAAPGGNGHSWSTAFQSLQEALALAASCPGVAEIWVAAGTYYPSLGLDINADNVIEEREKTFGLVSGVKLYGGFPSSGDPAFTDRDWKTHETILSGDIGTTGDIGDNTYHVLYASGVSNETVLDGFTVTGGNANGGGGNSYKRGGGMFNISGASARIANCSFTGNYTSTGGGGMYNVNSSPTLTNCSFVGNTSGNIGGGMDNVNSSPTLTNCSFTGNYATNTGGGMNNINSSPTLTNCSFAGNYGVYGGGMYNLNNSSPTLTNCSLVGNYASNSGGGMYNYGSNPTLTNCILWANSFESMYDVNAATITYSLVEGYAGGTDNYNLDGTDPANNPLFVLLPTVTVENGQFMGYTPGDLRLQACSPALNRGSNGAKLGPGNDAPILSSISTDLAGNPRFYNGGVVDLGAYEYQDELPAPPAITTQPLAGQHVVQGNPVTDLSVVATGTGLQYQWYSATEASNEGGQPIGNATSDTYTPSSAEVGTFYYYVVVTNTCGKSLASEVAEVVVKACAEPVVTAVTTPTGPVAITSSVSVGISYTGNPLTSATIHWGDGTAPQTVSSATASHTYATPGVYTVSATVTNDCGTSEALSALQYVVVYDPSAGFVTGGGWINSPAGAYAADPALTGKASFGFVSKYEKGANVPSGNTEFEFKAGNLNFKSMAYEWLTVAGARAQFKGSGTLNGQGGYSFMLTAVDGQVNGGGNVDKFRIKIWNGSGVVYDNKMGQSDTYDISSDASTVIGGGSIVIHTPKGKGARESYEPEPATGSLTLRAYPNPTTDLVRVEVSVTVAGEVQLEVMDLTGRPVQRRSPVLPAGLQVVEFDLGPQPSGLYLIRSRDAAGRQGVVRVARE